MTAPPAESVGGAATAVVPSGECQLAVVVAVIAVRVVQVPVNQVIDVIPVGHGVVAAARSVLMPGLVSRRRCASVRVLLVDRDPVLIDVVLMGMVQMPVVEKISVAVVADGDMAAVGAVLVIVAGMDVVLGLGHTSSSCSDCVQITLDPAPAVAKLPGTRTILSIAGACPGSA